MTTTRREEAAVEAAVAAACATTRRSGRGPAPGPSAAAMLEARLELDWSSFNSRAYELLREVARRRGFGVPDPAGESPDEPKGAGIKYESRYSQARRRLARARA